MGIYKWLMKKSYMSDDWIINVSRFAGYDRHQCPQNLQAQQLICVLYYTISGGKKYTVFTWKIDLTCVICWWHLASHNKTQEWGEAAHFHLSCLEGKIIWHLKKKAVLCIQSIKFISLRNVYEHPKNISCSRDFGIWTCAVTLSLRPRPFQTR